MKPLFIHIPKTAGQSVHKALGQKNGPHKQFRKLNPKPGRFVFTIVRNPYDRALSLFHWYRQLHLQNRKRTPHNAAMNMLAAGCRDASEFWTRFVQDYTMRYQRRYTPMMATQVSFLVGQRGTGEIAPRIDRILRFENLAEEWKQLSEELGIAPLPHVNRSVHLPWEKALSAPAKEVISNLYKTDFETLNYES